MRPFILSFLILVLVGCKNSIQEQYIQESKNFCAVFSAASWAEMKRQYQGADLMAELLRKVDEAVTTKEFEEVLDQQHLQPKNAIALYEFYVREVSNLTGKPFACEDLKFYFEQTIG